MSSSDDEIPFKTTKQQLKYLPMLIGSLEACFPLDTVNRVYDIAVKDQGMFDLVLLWASCETPEDRQEIEDSIMETIKDYSSDGAPL